MKTFMPKETMWHLYHLSKDPEEEGCGHVFHQDSIHSPQQGSEIEQSKNYRLVFTRHGYFHAVSTANHLLILVPLFLTCESKLTV